MALVVKNLPANAGDTGDAGLIPGLEIALEEGMVTHSSILAWRTRWTEEPGGLWSIGSQTAGHNWSNLHALYVLAFWWKDTTLFALAKCLSGTRLFGLQILLPIENNFYVPEKNINDQIGEEIVTIFGGKKNGKHHSKKEAGI